MAYTTQDYVSLINQYKDSNPGLAFALYNGLSGMGGGSASGTGGAVDQALRNAWGDSAATQWINHNDTVYGNAMFDPNTGQYGYYNNGALQSGTLSGWNPSNYGGATAFPTTAVANTYNPGTGTVTGSAANGFSPPPAGGSMPTATPPGAVGTTAPGTGHTPLIGSTSGYSNPLPLTALASTAAANNAPQDMGEWFGMTPSTGSWGAPPPAGGGYNPSSSGTVTPPPPTNTNSAINPGTSSGPQSLLSTAQSILGSSFLTNPDGSPNWTAMSTPDFFNTLTDAQKTAMENAHLGAAIRTSLGLPLLPGQTVPGWYSSTTNPNANTGASGGFPTADPMTYTPTQAAGYTIAPRSREASTPFDFLNDPGYQFILQQGLDQVNNKAAATGNLLSGNTLKALANYTTGLASQQYQNAYQDWMQKQQLGENQYQYSTNLGNQNYWNTQNFNNNANQFAANFNNANTQWATNFNNANRIDARNFDQGTAVDARNYQTALDQYNQQFGYNAALNDRNFNAQTLQSLAQMGLGASGTSGQLAATLAAILGQNTMTGATAGANATVGGANNVNNLVSSILAYLQQNNLVNTIATATGH